MFIFTMSALCSPYLASNSSSKMASSKVFEHSKPMLRAMRRAGLPALRAFMAGGHGRWQGEAPRRLAGLAGLHGRGHRALAAHADQGQLLGPARDGLGVGHGIGRVGV